MNAIGVLLELALLAFESSAARSCAIEGNEHVVVETSEDEIGVDMEVGSCCCCWTDEACNCSLLSAKKRDFF